MANKLEVILSVLTSGLENFDKTGKEMDGLKNKTNDLNSSTGALAKGFAAIPGVGTAVAAVLATLAAGAMALSKAMDFGDKITKQAETLDLSTDAVQKWNYVAKQAGSSGEAITNSFSKLTQNIYSASTGNKELEKTFRALGISLTDSNGNLRDTTSITDEVISKIADLKDPTEQAGVATELLGKGAKDLLPMLRQGSAAINEQKEAAEKYGQVLSEDAVKSLDQAGDALDTMKTALSVCNAEIMSNAVPALEVFTEKGLELLSVVSDLAMGLSWMVKGKDEFDKKMQENAAITKEIQELAALKKEMEAAVAAQESFKAHGSNLFDQDTLDSARETIRAINEELHSIANGESKKSGSNNSVASQKRQQEEKEKSAKEHNSAMKKLQSAFQKDEDESFKDAEKQFKARIALQNDYNKDVLKSESDIERYFKEGQNRKQKLTATLETLEIANEKNEEKRRKLMLDKQKKDIERAYQEQIKEADGSAEEISKANEIKINALKNAESAYTEWYKANEKTKKEVTVQNTGEVLGNYSSFFQEMTSKHKEWGNVYKATAISETWINAYKGAMAGFTGMVSSVPGPAGIVLGLAASALAIGQGVMQTINIAKQNFASGSKGVLNLPTIANMNEMGQEGVLLPAGSQVFSHHKTTQMINNNQKKTTVINVYVRSDNGKYDKKFVRELRNGSMDYATRQLKRKMGVK